jgi:pimeloyl-ACP methyl ester carboxylesterase
MPSVKGAGGWFLAIFAMRHTTYTPTAVAVFPQDYRTIRTFAERANNIVRYTEFGRGGHFAYTTDPDLVVTDLREFFGSLGENE